MSVQRIALNIVPQSYSNWCVADDMRTCVLCFWCRLVVDCFFFCLSEPKRGHRHSAFIAHIVIADGIASVT